jgi:ADP-heptose:LPS heptosyltransferase
MQAFGNILIFHPAAIGDAMLATPVAKALRLNFPAAKITYWSHQSLREMMVGLCPSVDGFIAFAKEQSFFNLVRTARQLKPDLFVDLSNSTRGKVISRFSGGRVLEYRKRSAEERPIMHAVENFLETVAPVCRLLPEDKFPTIYPGRLSAKVLAAALTGEQVSGKPMIGIVPGVGKQRAHRAWTRDGWVYLLDALAKKGTHTAALIGGLEEADLADWLARRGGFGCINLVGKLSLAETAAVLHGCDLVVAGDTGPAHLAVAVGTPVIGLHGPTFAARSGPYGYAHWTIQESQACQCLGAKRCSIALPDGSGSCMGGITPGNVAEKIETALCDLGKTI